MKSFLTHRQKLTTALSVIAVFWVCVTIVTFKYLHFEHVQKIRSAIHSQLKQDQGLNNFELLTRNLNDLSRLGLIRCAKVDLLRGEQTIMIFDRSFLGDCQNRITPSLDSKERFRLRAQSGFDFAFSLIIPAASGLSISFWLILFLGLAIVASVYALTTSNLKTREVLAQAKVEMANTQKHQAEFLNKIARQVAHDIRSPLTALRALTRTIRFEKDSTKETFVMALTRINDIAEDLLSKIRVQNKAQDLLQNYSVRSLETSADLPIQQETNVISLEDFAHSNQHLQLVENVSNRNCPVVAPYLILESVLLEKRIAKQNYEATLSLYCPDKLKSLLCQGQASDLARITSNLIDNSLDALKNSKSGFVSLSIDQEEDGEVTIEVRDNGCGISPDQLEQVLDGVSTKTSGNGLGLSHARKKVEEWGGEFSLQSQLNMGTTVRFRLPTA